jgi:glycosyltransferase involved in cell wall biosynthesis
MNEINEVTVFSVGDSADIKTWSNAPFFFTETLVSKGIKVNRVDLSPNKYFEKLHAIFFEPLVKLFFKRTTYGYFRSLVNFLDVRRRIKIASKKFSTADAEIFLTFSFSSAGISKKPSVQFCDWTFEHYFAYFESRKPDFFERSCIKRENSQIEGSSLVFPLFASSAEFMHQRYINKNIYYLGNVINSRLEISEAEILRVKNASHSILFVGRKLYLEGALQLLEAFKILKAELPSFQLHLVGINEHDLGPLSEGVHCHGYLDKGNDEQRELFFSLLKEAKVFVNTTAKWGAFSASFEALYSYTPVIVTPYDDFVKIFGRKIDFGVYFEEQSADALAAAIKKLVTDPAYELMCKNAHRAVKDFSWDAYIDKLLATMKEKL